MHRRRPTATIITGLLTLCVTALAAAAEHSERAHGMPFNRLRDAYFGDLHLHTNYSFDAYLLGARLDPDGAYRYAAGDTIVLPSEEIKRVSAPLDFAAVTDHAELIGVATTLADPASQLSRGKIGERLIERGIGAVRELGWPNDRVHIPGVDTKAIVQSAWQREIEAANRHYQPGRFTTFIGYEWTAQRDGRELHRNVIFRGNEAPLPFTASDSTRPEDLWAYLEGIRAQGYEALAIPHNSNLSDGMAFDVLTSEGKTIDALYAEQRAANEPLVEIAQNKGQSEVHPLLSPNDEFANFEVMDVLRQTDVVRLPGSYVRYALGRGLEISQSSGIANPYSYGFVGGSDFHNGMSDAAERAYSGVFGAVSAGTPLEDLDEWSAHWLRAKTDAEVARVVALLTKYSSGSLTGVWAEQNSRESIYAALRRKETFATSGTRLQLRFFGGWKFPAELLQRQDWIEIAYRAGVPMGSHLSRTKQARAPTFIVWSLKDPDGANLDRLQVVKVWLNDGSHLERVYDVVSSNAPRPDMAARVVTKDVQSISRSDAAGAVELSGSWTDPAFDPARPAAYYLRAIEMPTPRWTTIAAAKQRKPLPSGVAATIQERGWSSPIWYTPAAQSEARNLRERDRPGRGGRVRTIEKSRD